MTNKIYDKLKMLWLHLKPFNRPWYQYFETPDGFNNYRFVRDRGQLRTALMMDALEQLEFEKTDVVVDVGSNAGRFGIALSSKVKRSYGIELDKKFHRHALFLKEIFSRYQDLTNHVLINGDINANASVVKESTVTILGKVIYHKNLENKQSELLDTIFHSKLRIAVLQGHTTQGDFGEEEFMEKLLEQYGFTVKLRIPHHEYPILIGER